MITPTKRAFRSRALLTSLIFFCLFLGINCNTKPKTGQIKENHGTVKTSSELIEMMKKRGEKRHLKAFTFVQQTVHFEEDGAVRDTSVWHEAIRYPKEFRIDFGNPDAGNANINRNDSIYVYRNHEMVHSGPEIQEFLILEGGIFYYSVSETIERLKGLGIDTAVLSESSYNGKSVLIIGAIPGEIKKPQIWLDKENLFVVRRFSKSNQGNLYEVRYDDYKNIDGHWIETWIEFYRDGRLIQTERYTQIDVEPKLDDHVFDPDQFGKVYWFNYP
ncbi:hypothetical protein [Flagellimonas flava]|uniref:Outer membrane lipoprotein-sorting protein n=1 Tax=Flagellimonas flava TaxID=570519 RepID=A0A1M5JYY2_9FLAO|nr:hypothetical protein [Allomuricauda flava]SHG45766.1 hypothetical protein SAMN04488116_1296 [Allomuricauda flava]